jgi:hypothetical protein
LVLVPMDPAAPPPRRRALLCARVGSQLIPPPGVCTSFAASVLDRAWRISACSVWCEVWRVETLLERGVLGG